MSALVPRGGVGVRGVHAHGVGCSSPLAHFKEWLVRVQRYGGLKALDGGGGGGRLVLVDEMPSVQCVAGPPICRPAAGLTVLCRGDRVQALEGMLLALARSTRVPVAVVLSDDGRSAGEGARQISRAFENVLGAREIKFNPIAAKFLSAAVTRVAAIKRRAVPEGELEELVQTVQRAPRPLCARSP